MALATTLSSLIYIIEGAHPSITSCHVLNNQVYDTIISLTSIGEQKSYSMVMIFEYRKWHEWHLLNICQISGVRGDKNLIILVCNIDLAFT